MRERTWRDGDDGQPFVENPFNKKGKKKKVDLVGMTAQGIKDLRRRYDLLGGNKISRRELELPLESPAEVNKRVLEGFKK